MTALKQAPSQETPTSLNTYWALSPAALLEELNTTLDGLGGAEAARRLAQVGPNTLQTVRSFTALGVLLRQFRSPLVLILLAATVISSGLGEWTDAAITAAIVLGSALLGFWQEYRAGRAVEALRTRVTVRVRVCRDGREMELAAAEIVPGDVVLLAAGSLIPADGVVLAADDCFVNEAVLTGETYPAEKRPGVTASAANLAERSNVVLMGTSVRSGTARAVMVHTGAATAFGKVAGRLTGREPETEFERGVRRFGGLLTQTTLLLVVGVFAINVLLSKPPLESLLFSVALAVGMAPEMLPAIISVTLARGARDMAARGVIVRRLAAIENLGAMDVLCTDKTGTLTHGVVRLDGATGPDGTPSPEVERLAALNARLQTGLPNPLDEAILAAHSPDLTGLTRLGELPYDFTRKRLSVLVQEAGKVPRLITKGALAHVLDVCTSLREGKQDAPLAPCRAELEARGALWGDQGYRVLGVASRLVTNGTADETSLTFEGFLRFLDPPKADARASLEELLELGVRVKVITGDSLRVAQHVAQVVGLPVRGALSGTELNAMGEEALWHAVQTTDVFADVDPGQKERVIRALRHTGHVVGYLGDGINDAPALHAADVGLSVEGAVDVAREAADFVLLARDLGVLGRGIRLGRATFANTLKYVFTTTSANFGNMLSMAGTALFLPFLPLLPKQILLNNFLSDLPSMAIAADRVDPELAAVPRRWDTRFIGRFMVVFGLVSSVFDGLTFGLLLVVLRSGPAEFRTAWFTESLLTELIVTLIMRTRRFPFWQSTPGRLLGGATLLVALLALVLPYTPLAPPLGFVPLPPGLLAAILGITAMYVLTTDAVKRAFYRRVEENAPAGSG